MSFEAPSIGLTALVGPSGAGKTTALALIDRLMHVDDGAVDQQFALLEGSIRDNMLLGNPLSTEVDIIAALDAVGLMEEVADLPAGLDTELGRKADLSGRPAATAALARVLLSDAQVVLLDEPTSQLDNINERRVRQIIDKLAATRSVLVIAHRLSTVKHADHVVVVADGTVTDAGIRDQLMGGCSDYREFVSIQSSSDLTTLQR
ncbi:ATP-binding cassette domain-containing protein [Rhodococcus wratislaviensis]|uniref:ABC transporter domain-containing protein n=1 Tax=Rhodococcus wratislaviensis NBRC 100605 TaxID=1219028 RepID=X0Q4W7_RHOWR|nr:ATP-binding cassette domain-containing protein [Rhodococcus wratislaviensis]GAF45566.1 hypothetical protein RW1_022_01460 [Rhodococcus wratislaviensis NBRC 100605]